MVVVSVARAVFVGSTLTLYENEIREQKKTHKQAPLPLAVRRGSSASLLPPLSLRSDAHNRWVRRPERPQARDEAVCVRVHPRGRGHDRGLPRAAR